MWYLWVAFCDSPCPYMGRGPPRCQHHYEFTGILNPSLRHPITTSLQFSFSASVFPSKMTFYPTPCLPNNRISKYNRYLYRFQIISQAWSRVIGNNCTTSQVRKVSPQHSTFWTQITRLIWLNHSNISTLACGEVHVSTNSSRMVSQWPEKSTVSVDNVEVLTM